MYSLVPGPISGMPPCLFPHVARDIKYPPVLAWCQVDQPGISQYQTDQAVLPHSGSRGCLVAVCCRSCRNWCPAELFISSSLGLPPFDNRMSANIYERTSYSLRDVGRRLERCGRGSIGRYCMRLFLGDVELLQPGEVAVQYSFGSSISNI